MALSMLPYFLANFSCGGSSGWLLARYCRKPARAIPKHVAHHRRHGAGNAPRRNFVPQIYSSPRSRTLNSPAKFMEINLVPEKLRRLEIPGRVEIVNGTAVCRSSKSARRGARGNLPERRARHAFSEKRRAPLIFMSRKSYFAPGKAIRGGVPICFRGLAPRRRTGARLRAVLGLGIGQNCRRRQRNRDRHFALPEIAGRENWKSLRSEFIVTVGETLRWNCGHQRILRRDVGDRKLPAHLFPSRRHRRVLLTGLETHCLMILPSVRRRAQAGGKCAVAHHARDQPRLSRQCAAVESTTRSSSGRFVLKKFNSNSTVVWNPWTTQENAGGFRSGGTPSNGLCGTGNVKQNKLSLAPGKTSALKVVLSSAPLK